MGWAHIYFSTFLDQIEDGGENHVKAGQICKHAVFFSIVRQPQNP